MSAEPMLRWTPKLRCFVAALLLCLPVDQLTKYCVVSLFYYREKLPVIPGFFDLTYVRNPGGAFSFFASGPYVYRMVFFIGTGVLAVGLLLIFFRRLEPQARLAAVALGMILGGAVGNLIDRMAYGEVIDFLDFHVWPGFTWPTFNLADSFIVVGVGILMLEVLFERRADEPEPLDGAQGST